MYNPHWLRSFAALVETSSFTRAAERLEITQAAVSQHIRYLENQLGVLLTRRGRQLDLTPAGKALLSYCQELEQADKRLALKLSGEHTESGEVSIITPGSTGLMIFPYLLERMARVPGLVIRHRFAPDSEVIEAVAQNQYEVGIATRRPDDPRLGASQFVREPLELVVPAGQSGCEWAQLETLGFIDHPDGRDMATRLLSRRFPDNPGIRHLPVSGYTNQVGLILDFVAAGHGFTVLPRYARQAFARQQEIDVVDCGQSVVDTLWLIQRAEWPLSARAQHTVDYLRAIVRNEAAV
ncbi:LysR family transcriptional regulator [Entomohabitans teleogrylli]|uniref:LysR family transcriptional regulator n=1 Tax=Entomohabitans teleogrylli TaxID=1384589 RepID=UPI00073D67FE|nr:LysR family transcriptional regulator [Entomohabitans teleogrylli]